jgi:F-type H+-transporting ATPase subunit alpha
VVSIYSGVKGFIDEIPLAQVGRFEGELLELMRNRHRDVLDAIADSREISDATAQQLEGILKDFVASFTLSLGSAA